MNQLIPKNQSNSSANLLMKLWIYTNYDCNLSCPYCCAASSPKADRRCLSLETVKRLVDEAQRLGFQHLYFTGGEPFLLKDLYEMLAYASDRLPTTVLTNAMLLRGKRLEKLCAIQHENLAVQVSLDGGRPEHHDAYRGMGSWAKTIEGIRNLQEYGFQVRLATTETPANSAHLPELCEYHQSLGIPEQDHLIRPMAKRGFAKTGLEVSKDNLTPEMTLSVNGVFWHPISTAADMQVSDQLFPLEKAVCRMQTELNVTKRQSPEALNEFN